MNSSKKFFTGFITGVQRFGNNITIIINTLLLSFVYFIGIGITSIIAKIVKKKFLDLTKEKKSSYWSDLNLDKRDIDKYYRQF